MKKSLLAWMVGGTLVVAGAFFIPGQAGSIWPSVIWATVAAIGYLAVFSFYWLRNIGNKNKRRTIGIALVVLVAFSIISASFSYVSSQRQMDLLQEIRVTIESGIAEVQVKDPLLKTLREYHKGYGNTELGMIFKNKYDSLITADSLYEYMGPGTYAESDNDSELRIYVEKVQPDTVKLIASAIVTPGRSVEFRNRSGEEGKFQVEAILTKEGLHYERVN